MRTHQQCTATAHFAIHDRSRATSCIASIHTDAIRLGIGCEHLDPLVLVLVRIDKDTTAVVIHLEALWHTTLKPLPFHLDLGRPGARLGLILEAWKCAAPAYSREELQFAVTDDLHPSLANLKLALGRAIVASCTETEVGTAALDESANPLVAGAVQGVAVLQIGTAGHDEQRTCGLPWFGEKSLGGQWQHSVVGSQDAAQGEEGMAEGIVGGASTWMV